MDKKAFAELVSSVQDMGRYMRGGKVAGMRVTTAPDYAASQKLSEAEGVEERRGSQGNGIREGRGGDI